MITDYIERVPKEHIPVSRIVVLDEATGDVVNVYDPSTGEIFTDLITRSAR